MNRIAAVVLLAVTAPGARAAGLDPVTEIAPFVREVAANHDLDPAEATRVLARARVLNNVLDLMSRPAEAKPWKDYRQIFLIERRIADGARYWREHADTLDVVSERYGVSPRVIVAIIGVETLYGQRAGNIRVLDALATLGFRYPKRAAFFRRELGHYLALAGEEALDPLTVEGSYAGAMGIGQFIPSSYRAYAVDHDGDGTRNLLSDHGDAIASVANYLARHGWVRGAPVAVPAQVSGDAVPALLERGYQPHTTLSELRTRGVTPSANVVGAPRAALIELDGADGAEHWVVFDNFYAITRYNHSKLYAMAVHQLSEAIEARYRANGQ